MKKSLFLGITILLAAAVSACGDHSRDTFFAQTLSDVGADGDVSFDPASSAYTVFHASSTGNVIFGINDAVPNDNSVEYRAFLDFPLNGAAGGDVVPINASIVSADIEVFVDNVVFASTVPTLLDLVTYDAVNGPNGTVDYNSAPLASRAPFDILSSDAGRFVRIDVTTLMREAQRRGLQNFQVRFLLDFVPGAAGLVTISDSRSSRAPLLTVEYR